MTEYEQRILKQMEQSLYCPVCSLLEEEEFSMMANLQYDVTHRPELRETVTEEGGFRDYHFRQFRKIASAKTNVLVLMAMIARYVQPGKQFVVHCRFCGHLDPYQGRLIEAISFMLMENSFRTSYTDYRGMCKRQLESVEAGLSDEPTRGWLKEVHRDQMLKEIPYVELVATKSYYDTCGFARGSVYRTTEKFLGRRG